LKLAFLEALLKAETIPYFYDQSETDFSFLDELQGFLGLILRFYSGRFDGSWKTIISNPWLGMHLDVINDFAARLEKDKTENRHEELHSLQIENRKILVYLSPYIVEGYHLGDLTLIQEITTLPETKSIFEWHLFSDRLAFLICSKFQYPDHVAPKTGSDSDKFLSIIRETGQILIASNRASALTIQQETQQAAQWFEEDLPVINRFMSKIHQELNLHTVFILQNAAPGFIHKMILASAESEDITCEISDMFDAIIQLDPQIEQSLTSEKTFFTDVKFEKAERLAPMVFSCQAGGQTFGHLGIYTTHHNLSRYLSHRSKILPMLASQLGFYFSHLFQIRREALESRMLQQINQTCNTIMSSVDIGAIVFKLVECLNELFRQYSGAILITSDETQDLEITTHLGGPNPDDFSMHEALQNHPQIVDLIYEGAVFDNSDGKYPLPIRYILPLSVTPQGLSISPDLQTPRSLGAVILYEHPNNRHLSEANLQKMMPILLNAIGASLQVARNYAEKLETIKQLERLMEKISDTDSLLDEMIDIVRRLLKVNRVSFLTLDEHEEYLYIKKEFGLPAGVKEKTKIHLGEEISGFVARTGKSLRIDNIELDSNFKKRSMEYYLNRSLLSVPLISIRGEQETRVIGVINVNNKSNGLTFTQQDQQLLEAIAHIVVTALEKVRYLEEKHEKSLLDRQLKDACDIQMSLMPKNFSDFPDSIEVYGESQPARQIGGDFFDLINLENGKILLILGDVSGKGMPAAILMAVSRMILRSVIQDTVDLSVILDKVNAKLTKELDSYHFVTLQIVSVDPITGESEMCSAGHGPLMVYLKGEVRLIETKGGPPLGIPGISGMYDKQVFTMNPGDCLIMFTDGLSEEHSKKGEMFGSRRIMDFLAENSRLGAKNLTRNLINEAVSWRGSQEAHDDLTILSFKFKEKADEDKRI